jgi:hypothetical protein
VTIFKDRKQTLSTLTEKRVKLFHSGPLQGIRNVQVHPFLGSMLISVFEGKTKSRNDIQEKPENSFSMYLLSACIILF